VVLERDKEAQSTDRVRNEEVRHGVKGGEQYPTYNIKNEG
jgi:hypothetical protein